MFGWAFGISFQNGGDDDDHDGTMPGKMVKID